MEFGRVEKSELKKINFSLPADSAQTKKVLSKSKKSAELKIFAGCAKWARPDWIGSLYPQKTKAADFLREYAKQLNCIEHNAAFYGLPTPQQIEEWKSKVGKDFLFCPKFPDTITHLRRLKNVEELLSDFFIFLQDLGKNLGPVFLMPHPQMGAKHFETIIDFLDLLPTDIDVFVELRNPEWYKKENAAMMFSALEKRKRGTVITDAAGRRDCVHMNLTTPKAFIRFVGNSLDDSDYSRIDEWVQRIKKWSTAGLKECYFFMHQHDEKYSPYLIKYLIEELNKHCKLNIKVPHLYDEGLLF